MSVFVDTSAILAALNKADQDHPRIGATLRELIESEELLFTTSYIVVEMLALLQRRLGMEAVHTFERDIIPLLDIDWIDAEVHRTAMASFLAASRRHLSFVDCVSFDVMHRRGLTRALALDGDFTEHVFEQIPGLAPEETAPAVAPS
ncbi:MAG TPA: PIN domain-containing protein [Thermoanaerobaculia bacterium]|nr:PIN domain-containing protein [Thermoanaerobaculia bacterium]